MKYLELKHFGVLGMHWGVRRGANSVKTNPKTHKGLHIRLKKKEDPTKNMDDKQLRERLNRLQMEKQYSELTKKKVSKGRIAVTKILGTSATGLATAYSAQYMKKGVQLVTSKVLDILGDQVAKAVSKT
jgi:hypothetical protein